MKCFVVLATVFVMAKALSPALIEDMKLQVQEYGILCAESEKATAEDLEALMNQKAPPTHAGRCVIFCVSKKLGLMNEDGSIAEPQGEWLDKLKADDPDAYTKMEEIYDTCKGKVEEKDGCEASLEFVSCAKYEGKKVGLDQFLE